MKCRECGQELPGRRSADWTNEHFGFALVPSDRSVTFTDGRWARVAPAWAILLQKLIAAYPALTHRDAAVATLWPNPDTQPESGHSMVKAYIMHLRAIGIRIQNVYMSGWRLLAIGEADEPVGATNG